jgi:hypothetical protein
VYFVVRSNEATCAVSPELSAVFRVQNNKAVMRCDCREYDAKLAEANTKSIRFDGLLSFPAGFFAQPGEFRLQFGGPEFLISATALFVVNANETLQQQFLRGGHNGLFSAPRSFNWTVRRLQPLRAAKLFAGAPPIAPLVSTLTATTSHAGAAVPIGVAELSPRAASPGTADATSGAAPAKPSQGSARRTITRTQASTLVFPLLILWECRFCAMV